MSSWVDQLRELYLTDESNSDLELLHYGVGHDANPPGRGSGRYPFGSGDRVLQDHWDLKSRVEKLKKEGMSEREIAKAMGFYQTDKNGNPVLDANGEPKPSTSKLRARYTIAKNYVRQEGYVKAVAKYDNEIDPDTGKPYTNVKIAELLDTNESSIRSYRNSITASENASKPEKVANELKELLKDGEYIDVGRGAELSLGVSPEGLKVALEMLKEEGYQVSPVWIEQVGGQKGNSTIINVLYPPDVSYEDVYKNRSKIRPVEEMNGETTLSLLGMEEPVKVSLDRIEVRFAEEGGANKDGVIEIRARRDENGNLVPISEDLSLGNAKYAQVRIATEGNHYIKGMAVYNTDLPEGVDILVNSNKSEKKGKEGALKDMKMVKDKDGNVVGIDPDNPFGATVYQSHYIDADGNKKLSAINIVGDTWGVDQHKEGAWDEWSRNLPAQFLSKQSEALIKQQLKLKVQEKQEEYDEIMQINNPVVKKQMLKDFAESCDSAAVDLKAAALPGQRVQVLLPLETIADNEVYAPNYENGTTLALIRYPHTGPFEIPIVKVNNNVKEAKNFLEDARGQALDAIGMSKKTAEILSGADFDGDTVTCIPMTRKNSQGEFERSVNIKGIGNGQERLPHMENFETTTAYPGTDSQGNVLPGVKLMDKRTKGLEMGRISNLITDMSLKGCEDPEELSRAVRYSMIVVDAEKHKLNYQQAEKDLNIKELRDKYQNNGDGSRGVSTLISRSKSPVNDITQRQAWSPSKQSIDPETGEKIYKLAPNRFYTVRKEVKVKDPETGKYVVDHVETVKDKNGNDRKKNVYKTEWVEEVKERKISSTRMAEAKDARELLSANPSNKEILYADFANKMKSMGNTARKEWLNVPKLEANPEAKKQYKEEIKSLNEKAVKAKLNAPRERQAQILATEIIRARLQDNPDLYNDKEEYKRIKGQALNGARARTGAKKQRIQFTEKEWEAINAGAITETKLKELLANADSESYKKLATPKQSRVSESTANRINGLLSSGWSREDIANAGYASMDTIIAVQKGQY